MKQLIVKGNMPQDCCFYAVSYEDGNIFFSVRDNNNPKASYSSIIKSEDELIDKLLTTAYYDDDEYLEIFTKRFNKFSWCIIRALGVDGEEFLIHYKQKISNK